MTVCDLLSELSEVPCVNRPQGFSLTRELCFLSEWIARPVLFVLTRRKHTKLDTVTVVRKCRYQLGKAQRLESMSVAFVSSIIKASVPGGFIFRNQVATVVRRSSYCGPKFQISCHDLIHASRTDHTMAQNVSYGVRL